MFRTLCWGGKRLTRLFKVTEAVVYETSEQPTKNTKIAYTRESATLSEISTQVDEKLSNLRGIVENLITMQSLKTGEGKGLNYDQIMKKYDGKLKEFYQNLEVDDSFSIPRPFLRGLTQNRN